MARRDLVKQFLESAAFQNTIIGVIVVNAIVLGVLTIDGLDSGVAMTLHVMDRGMLAAFVVELALRLYAHGLRFFRDPWSVFDLLVVAIALVPTTGALSMLRSFRIVRALRLVTAVPGMRRVIRGLLSALPSMVSIILLLVLVLYVGAVLATELYGDAEEHFGNVGKSLFTLFQVMTGEAWPDVARDVLENHPEAWIFFVLYILVSTFIVLNLFTAVVVSGMEPERQQEMMIDAAVLAEIKALRAEIAELRAQQALSSSAAVESGQASGAPSSITVDSRK